MTSIPKKEIKEMACFIKYIKLSGDYGKFDERKEKI